MRPNLRSAADTRLSSMEDDESLFKLKAVAQCPIEEAVPKVLELVVDSQSGRPSTKVIEWLLQHQWLRKLWESYPIGEQDDVNESTRLILYLVVYGKVPLDPFINTTQFEPLVTRVKMSKGTPLVFRFLTLVHRETYVYDNVTEWINKIETESPDYIEQLLLLLSVGNSSRHLMSLIKRSRIVARCRALHSNQAIYLLTEVLSYYLNIRSGVSEFEQFERLQSIVHSNFGEKYAEFIVIASPQIWGHDNLRRFIESLTIEEKEIIIKDIERGGDYSIAPKLTESVMDEVIYAFVCIPYMSENSTIEPTRADEYDLFDRFVDARFEEEKIKFILPFETAPLDETDYMIRTRVSVWQQSCFDLSRHLEAVMDRFVTSGASKYMFPVSHIQKIVSEEYEIETTAPLKGTSFFLLTELVPPNPYDNKRRLKDWGLNLVRLCKVEPSDSEKVEFSCKNAEQVSGFEQRMNWVIMIPHDLIGPDQIKYLETKEFAIPSVHEAEDVVESSVFANSQEMKTSEPNVKRAKLGDNEPTNTPHLQTEGVFQSIVHNKFTLVHEMSRFNTSDMIIERVLNEDLKHRTLVLTSSQQHVNSFSHNPRWVRYGSEQDLDDWRNDLKQSRELLMKRGLADMPMVEVIAQWETYLDKYSPSAPSTGSKRGATSGVVSEKEAVQNYPFSSELSTIRDVVDDYHSIFDAYVAIDWLGPLDDMKCDPWEYLFNQRNVIMSIDEYVRLSNDINDSSYLSNRRLRGFDHVIVVNGVFYAIPIACPAYEIQMTVIGGSQSDTVPICDINLDDSLVRPEFISNPNVPMIPIDRVFNPGFADTASIIATAGQIDNAEFCVLLFQYMRLLNYPAHRITILVTTPRHQALVKEILHNWCGEKVARDGSDFQYGWPAGVELRGDNRVRVNDYAIISLFDESDEGLEEIVDFSDPEVAKSMYMGRFGNYILSTVGSSIILKPGETFASTERSNVATKIIATRDAMQSYVKTLYNESNGEHSS